VIVGLVLFVTAALASFMAIGHLSNYRSPGSSYRFTPIYWLSSDTYTPEGQRRLARLLPWIVVLWALQAAGAITFFTHL